MRGPRELAPALVAAVALAGVISAAQLWARTTAAVPDVPEDATPAWIEVVPHVESVMERGQAQQFRAIVRDRKGRPVEDAEVTWSVSRPVGTISQGGLFLATTACLPWDGIGLVIATLDAGIPGRRTLSDGALVAIHHDPRCLPTVTAAPVAPSGSGRAP